MVETNQLICGDCLKILPRLGCASLIWADPPDNINAKYDGYSDNLADSDYIDWLYTVIEFGQTWGDLFWLSYNAKWMQQVLGFVGLCPKTWRQIVWHYTFGQNRQTDFVSSYRPLLRMMWPDTPTYPNQVRVPSARQTKYGDKRASARGKLPDDVWEFPRVCGTFHERKKWHPCQHPKDLLRRVVLFSTKPGDLVIDMFAGTGNMLEVCEELGRRCIGIDISETYCKNIVKEHPNYTLRRPEE